MTAPHQRVAWREVLDLLGVCHFVARLNDHYQLHQSTTLPTVTLVGRRKMESYIIGWWHHPEKIGDMIADDLFRLRGDYVPVRTLVADGLPYQRDCDPIHIVKPQALGAFTVPPFSIVFERDMAAAISYALRFNPYETGAKS